MKREKRLHFYEEASLLRRGRGSFTSMKKEKRLGAWLWSLAMELEARERSSSRKMSMARASLCSQKREKGLFI